MSKIERYIWIAVVSGLLIIISLRGCAPEVIIEKEIQTDTITDIRIFRDTLIKPVFRKRVEYRDPDPGELEKPIDSNQVVASVRIDSFYIEKIVEKCPDSISIYSDSTQLPDYKLAWTIVTHGDLMAFIPELEIYPSITEVILEPKYSIGLDLGYFNHAGFVRGGLGFKVGYKSFHIGHSRTFNSETRWTYLGFTKRFGYAK